MTYNVFSGTLNPTLLYYFIKLIAYEEMCCILVPSLEFVSPLFRRYGTLYVSLLCGFVTFCPDDWSMSCL